MVTTEKATANRSRSEMDTKLRAGGVWLAFGSALGIVSLVIHPVPSPDPAAFVATIADDPTLWSIAHWAGAIALSLFVVAGLIVLTAGSRLTRTWWTVSAWALLVVGALWVTTAALTEATAISEAAAAGDVPTFETWMVFADAHDFGFVALGIATAAIAVNEARTSDVPKTTSTWAAWIGAVAGIVVVVAWVLGVGVGIAMAIPVWLVSLIVMLLWVLWFGAALVRSDGGARPHPEVQEPSREAIR